jgi:hypothetical protein
LEVGEVRDFGSLEVWKFGGLEVWRFGEEKFGT